MTGTIPSRDGRQLVLDLPLRPALGREDFLVAGSNVQAVEMIDRWPDWLNPALVIFGPAGCGKTHLAEVWRGRSGASVCCCDDLAVDLIPRLLSDGAVVVEDAPGHPPNERAMFHLLNAARESQAYVLMVSRRHPLTWKLELKDLISRLRAIPVAALSEPDDTLLRALLVKLFADRQLDADEQVLSYMVTHMERSGAAACELVAAMDRTSLERKSAVTRHLAAQVLRDLAGPGPLFRRPGE
jgi:chromosomal replication initiation ATPase DnaA